MIRVFGKLPEKRKPAIRRILLAKYGNLCHWCGTPMEKPTIEHLVPTSLGGTNYLSNLRLACAPCNTRRGSGERAEPAEASDGAAFADMEGRQ